VWQLPQAAIYSRARCVPDSPPKLLGSSAKNILGLPQAESKEMGP